MKRAPGRATALSSLLLLFFFPPRIAEGAGGGDLAEPPSGLRARVTRLDSIGVSGIRPNSPSRTVPRGVDKGRLSDNPQKPARRDANSSVAFKADPNGWLVPPLLGLLVGFLPHPDLKPFRRPLGRKIPPNLLAFGQASWELRRL